MDFVRQAVEPLRADAIERARQGAEEAIKNVHIALAAHEWNINAAAPYPRALGGGLQFFAARAKHNLFHAVTQQDPARGYQSNNGTRPVYVVMDAERGQRYITQQMEQAAAEYDAFVTKLINKVGDVVAAVLHGNHVWSYSTLIVTKPDGSKVAWQTQQIINYSKHGKPFNQWPSRKLRKVPTMEVAAA